mgnify:FL=1|tara:strand:+ start:3964 stop:4317 length:354 start_codon:yes stop_codon:yes gene_type:complete
MKGYILSDDEINSIKIIIAVMARKDISFDLRANKIWELSDILRIPLPEAPSTDEEDVDLLDPNRMFPIPVFVIMMEEYTAKGNMKAVRIAILERLIELNAFEEIIELGLDKIKLNKR